MRTELNLFGEVYFAICKAVNTPTSLAHWLCYRDNQRELLSLPVDPSTYVDPKTFALDYGVKSLVSKYKGLDTGIDTAAVAIDSFIRAEEQCRMTNKRIRESRSTVINPLAAGGIFTARRKIQNLLGKFSWSKVRPYYGWGPGATSSIPRKAAQVDRKMTLPPSVTSAAWPVFQAVIRHDLHWSASVLGYFPSGEYSLLKREIVEENRVVTVPKSAKTQRVIAAEPTGNLFLQKGFGGYFRKVLKRVGVDLDDQTINQDAAAKAYLDGLATIDLRSASDTLSTQLVYELIPSDWFDALSTLRCRFGIYSDPTSGLDRKVYYEKFSSMGNGYTFELESLIFWALSSACMELKGFRGQPFVYGDDIIVPQAVASDVIQLLSFAGFETNLDKTFVSGNFFESCGRHYFAGYDVSPPYQKEVVSDVFEAIRFHNRIVRWLIGLDMDPTFIHGIFARKFGSVFDRYVLSYNCEGDSGFVRDLTSLTYCAFSIDRNRGFRVGSLEPKSRRLPAIETALLAVDLRKRSRSHNRGYLEFVFPNAAKPSYGDIELLSEKYVSRHRWVMPQGVCVTRA